MSYLWKVYESMSKHIEIKHKVKSINRKVEFNNLLEESMLNETEKQFMKMFYIENKNISYIADVLGYTSQGISKMHKRILNKIESLL